MTLMHSDFTKNPNKVINFTFHRLVKLHPSEMVSKQDVDQLLEERKHQLLTTNASSNKTIVKGDPYQSKILLREEPIVSRQNVSVSQSFIKPPPLALFKSSLGSAFKSKVVVQPGSINQILEQGGQGDEEIDQTLKFKLVMEFDNCVEYKGEVKDSRSYDID